MASWLRMPDPGRHLLQAQRDRAPVTADAGIQQLSGPGVDGQSSGLAVASLPLTNGPS
jgi:hypothetical protein